MSRGREGLGTIFEEFDIRVEVRLLMEKYTITAQETVNYLNRIVCQRQGGGDNNAWRDATEADIARFKELKQQEKDQAAKEGKTNLTGFKEDTISSAPLGTDRDSSGNRINIGRPYRTASKSSSSEEGHLSSKSSSHKSGSHCSNDLEHEYHKFARDNIASYFKDKFGSYIEGEVDILGKHRELIGAHNTASSHVSTSIAAMNVGASRGRKRASKGLSNLLLSSISFYRDGVEEEIARMRVKMEGHIAYSLDVGEGERETGDLKLALDQNLSRVLEKAEALTRSSRVRGRRSRGGRKSRGGASSVTSASTKGFYRELYDRMFAKLQRRKEADIAMFKERIVESEAQIPGILEQIAELEWNLEIHEARLADLQRASSARLEVITQQYSETKSELLLKRNESRSREKALLKKKKKEGLSAIEKKELRFAKGRISWSIGQLKKLEEEYEVSRGEHRRSSLQEVTMMQERGTLIHISIKELLDKKAFLEQQSYQARDQLIKIGQSFPDSKIFSLVDKTLLLPRHHSEEALAQYVGGEAGEFDRKLYEVIDSFIQSASHLGRIRIDIHSTKEICSPCELTLKGVAIQIEERIREYCRAQGQEGILGEEFGVFLLASSQEQTTGRERDVARQGAAGESKVGGAAVSSVQVASDKSLAAVRLDTEYPHLYTIENYTIFTNGLRQSEKELSVELTREMERVRAIEHAAHMTKELEEIKAARLAEQEARENAFRQQLGNQRIISKAFGGWRSYVVTQKYSESHQAQELRK